MSLSSRGINGMITLLLSQIKAQSPHFKFPWQHIWKFSTFLNFQSRSSQALRIEPYIKSLGPTAGPQERLEDFSVCELCSLYNRRCGIPGKIYTTEVFQLFLHCHKNDSCPYPSDRDSGPRGLVFSMGCKWGLWIHF